MNDTAKALFRYAKSENSSFDWHSLRTNVLGAIYHENMTQGDVFRVVFKEYQELHAEPRYALGHSFDLNEVLLAPTKLGPWGSLGAKGTDMVSLESLYDSMLATMLHAFMFSRIDWCRELIWGESHV